MGRDVDGKWKKLSELSYRPLDHADPDEFVGLGEDATKEDGLAVYVDAAGEEKKVLDLAIETCYRTYRLIGIVKTLETISAAHAPQGDGWAPQGLKGTEVEPQEFADIKLQAKRAEQYTDLDGPDAIARLTDCGLQVTGRWFESDKVTTPLPRAYVGSVSIDAEFGFLVLSEPAFLITDHQHRPAELFVDVAFHAGRDGLFHRKSKEINTGEHNGTGALIINRDDVQHRVIQRYGFTGAGGDTGGYQAYLTQVLVPFDADGDVDAQLQYWVDANLAQFEPHPNCTRTYKRLMQLAPDGRIRQVTWSGGGGAVAKTQVSVNTDHNPYVPTIEEQRRRRRADESVKAAGRFGVERQA